MYIFESLFYICFISKIYFHEEHGQFLSWRKNKFPSNFIAAITLGETVLA